MGETNANRAEQPKDQIPRPPSSVTSDDAEVKVPMRFYRRRSCHICCGVTTVVLLALVIIVLVLSFTYFKAKDPVISVTGISIKSFAATVNPSYSSVRLDVALHLNVTVYNPNAASFKYENSSTILYYRGGEVGRAAVPSGQVRSKKTERLETDLQIQSLNVALNSNVSSDLQAGIIPINTYSLVRGKLNVINIFKHHAISTTQCSAEIFVSNTSLKDFKCSYSIKL